MEIKYQDIILRDMRESDIDDEIRWNTAETGWAQWDAPWEMEEELRAFDPEKQRREQLEWIARPKPEHRLSLEIDAGGVHIGAVNAYCIDDGFNWKSSARSRTGEKSAGPWASISARAPTGPAAGAPKPSPPL